MERKSKFKYLAIYKKIITYRMTNQKLHIGDDYSMSACLSSCKKYEKMSAR